MESNTAAAPRPDPMVGQHIGSYRVLRKLGEGGMGAVFEAVHEQIGKRAAIKVLHPQFSKDPEFARRFFNEARAVNIVQHNGVVSIFDFGQLKDGTAFIVMDYLDGETLSARLRRMGGKLGMESLNITRQIASTLHAAHQKGIIHRDLKPANIVIVPEPEAPGGERAKVLDFGVAKLAVGDDDPSQTGEAHEDQPATRTGVFMGTPKYMAPEQCRGAGKVDDKADVYSLGAMLYQMLSGRPPFVAPGEGEVMAMHIFAQVPSLREKEPSVPEDLHNLVHAMLSKKPEERPNMGQVATELGRLSGALTGAFIVPPQLSGAFPVGPVTLGSIPAVPSSVQPLTLTGSAPPVQSSGLSPSIAITGKDGVGPSLGDEPSATPGSETSPTLGAAAGQASGPLRTRRSLVLYVGVAALFVATVSGVLFATREKDKPLVVVKPQPPKPLIDKPPVDQVPVAKVQKIRWTINSEPAGATVTRETDKAVLGKTPLSHTLEAAQGQEALVLSLEGHKESKISLGKSTDQTHLEKLSPVDPEPVSKKPGKGKRKGKKEREDLNDEDIPVVK